MEIIGVLLIIAILLYLAFWLLVIILSCVAIGLIIGVFIAIFTSVKSYFISINKEVSNPIIKWTLNVCMGIGALLIAGTAVTAVVGIITSIV